MCLQDQFVLLFLAEMITHDSRRSTKLNQPHISYRTFANRDGGFLVPMAESEDELGDGTVAYRRLWDGTRTIEGVNVTRGPREIGVFGLFQYGTSFDFCLMLVGTIFSISMGASLPVLGLIFGEMTDVFIDVTKRGFKNTTLVNETFGCNEVDCSTVDDRISLDDFLSYMTTCSIYYMLIALSAFISSFIQTFCWDFTCERQTYRIRRIYFSQILRQDVSYYETNKMGNLNTKLSDDIERIREGMGSKFGLVIQFGSTFITGVLIGLYADWLLTLCLLVVFPVIYFVGSYSSQMAASSAQRELLKYAAASEIAQEVLSSVKTVAAYSAEKKEHARYTKALYEGRDMAVKKYVSYSFSMFLVNSVTYICYGIGFWLACYFITNGYSTPGDVFTVFFSVMLGAFTLGGVLPFHTAVMTAVGAARTVYKIMERVPEIDPYSNVGSEIQNFTGHIKFENVSFRYPSRTEIEVFSNLNLEIAPGSKVAIVGPSGVGKSSIVNLLMRYYDPTSGQVLFDERDIKHLKLKWLRSSIGLVSQEPVLFGVSIRDNISHGRENVSLEEVVAAAKLANAHNFISKLPEGYNTLVTEIGGNLSGGQKQRIAIARAVVREPKILLLDEATSSLDYQSEKAVQQALKNVMKGRTTIIIAHRLSTIKDVEKIFVLKGGSIVESGNHEDLISLKGHYHALIVAQKKEEEDRLKKEKTSVRHKKPSEKPSTSQEKGKGDAENDHNEDDVDDEIVQPSSGTAGQDYVFEQKNESVPLRLLLLQRKEFHLVLVGLIMCTFAGSVQPLFAFLYGEIFSTFSLVGDEMAYRRDFWTAIFVIFGLTSGLSYALWSFTMAKAAEYLIARIRDKAMINVLVQEMSWFDYSNCSPGVVITRLARDAPIVKHVAGVRIGQILSSVAGFTTAMAIAWIYGWKLALVLLIVVPFVLCGSYRQVAVTRRNIYRDLTLLDKAGKIASECVQNLKTVQALGRENDFVEEYMDLLWEPYRQSKRNAFRYGLIYALSHSISFVMYGVAFYAGSILIGDGDMMPGDVYRVFFALSFTAVAVGQSAAYLVDFAKGVASSRMVLDLIDKKSQADPRTMSGIRPELSGSVSFKNIKFSYPTRKEIVVLDDFNLEINSGETIALVGESGCGKSTIAALLERFYFPDEGQILVDGEDISTLSLHHLRRQIGIVAQNPVLFNCTIKENIFYGVDTSEGDEVSHADLVNAAKTANAHDFISELPRGYDTVCGPKGSLLSGGQKQRIAIARALIRRPKILLLDEATAALDAENEQLVQEALERAREGRTCIIIAHNLKTVENADNIHVLKDGKIVEIGTHAALMEKKGHYWTLYNQGTDN